MHPSNSPHSDCRSLAPLDSQAARTASLPIGWKLALDENGDFEGHFEGPRATRKVKEDLSGMLVGNYRLVRQLGVGGIGSVWLGEHPVIGSQVAIKVLHPETSRSEDATRRFVVEAQAVNRIACPHVVRIFDFGSLPSGRRYAVMEHLEGETLGDRMACGPLTWSVARRVGVQLLEAMEAVHEAGVVHRDLKPENVHLGPDPDAPDVKVLDFGIAKLLDATRDDNTNQLGICVGTPAYAAPEQLRGESVTPAADIYACGELLFEMLVGQAPFTGTLRQIVRAKVTQGAEPIANLVPLLPRAVTRLVDAMLAQAPRKRPTATEALEVLRTWLGEEDREVEVAVPCVPPPSPSWSAEQERETTTTPPYANRLPDPPRFGPAEILGSGADLFKNVAWGTADADGRGAMPSTATPTALTRQQDACRRGLLISCAAIVVMVFMGLGWLAFTLGWSSPADARVDRPAAQTGPRTAPLPPLQREEVAREHGPATD